MKLLFLVLLLLLLGLTSRAQAIEAVNEDSTKRVLFRLGQGVECELNANNQSVQVRGKISYVDSVSFRLNVAPGFYTAVYLNNVVRMRSRAYNRRRATAAMSSMGQGIGRPLTSPTPTTVAVVAVSALVGLGLALASERTTFKPRDPSIYQGWSFRSRPDVR